MVRTVKKPEERRQEIVSEVIGRFDVDIPQRGEGEMEGLLDYEAVDWQEEDHFYESARSLFNDISIVVKITFDYHGMRETFLFPGDLTNWSLLIANHPVAIRGCITKIPHHGSDVYVKAVEYSQSLLSSTTRPGFWQRLPQPWHHLWEECYYIFWHHREIPFPWLMSPWSSVPFLSMDMDSYGVYEYLAPKHSLIYPIRSSYHLPRLDVRNAIKANSTRTSCNFDQGAVSATRRNGKDACMDCYDCVERGHATVFDWA